jgi:hypothetical protein
MRIPESGTTGSPPPPDYWTVPLLLLNGAVTCVAAASMHWPVLLMLWTYATQACVALYFTNRRVLALERFSTEGMTVSRGVRAPADDDTRRRVARELVLNHIAPLLFGVFFAALFTFGDVKAKPGVHPTLYSVSMLDVAVAIALGLGSVLTFSRTFARYRANDRDGFPLIKRLGEAPMARILSLVAMAMITASQGDSPRAIYIMIAMATLGEILLHVNERSLYKRMIKR